MRRLLPALLLLLGAVEQESARPNILWITCEDISPNVGCYGDTYAVTPNIDKLATPSRVPPLLPGVPARRRVVLLEQRQDRLQLPAAEGGVG